MPKDNSQSKEPIVTIQRIKRVLTKLGILELFLGIVIVLCYYFTIPVNSSRVIYIPKGNISSIISYLDKSNYDVTFIDEITLRILGYPQSGWIDLQKSRMSKADFLYKLTTSKAALKTATLIPGETYHYFLKELATKLHLSYKKLLREYFKLSYKKEGNILAESYNLPIGMSEEHLIYYLVKFTDKKYEEFSKKIFGTYDKKGWYKYITIASIIQKEAANKKEMPLVSSVIYNRLKKNMKLQMDGTLNYGINSHKKVTREMIKSDKTPYNTYKYKGLPTDPVCAVSLESIKAAIFPAKTDYLYFVKNGTNGEHFFSTNYKEHLLNIKKSNKKVKKRVKRVKKKKSKYTVKEKSVFTKSNKKKSIKTLWENIK